MTRDGHSARRRTRGRLAPVVVAVAAMVVGAVACGERAPAGGAAAGAAGDSVARTGAARGADTTVTGAVRGCPARSAGDTAVRRHLVNRGAQGMMARTRWLASPDGCALLVVEDPISVEAEPYPNGGLLVDERGTRPVVITIDSVWDVTPDAAWTRLAWGRGWIVRGGESETVPPDRWQALAKQTGLDAALLERISFPASGMSYARGVSLAFERPLGDAPARARAIGPGGWRVRWRGDTLFVGTAPKMVQDASEPEVWSMHLEPDREPIAIPAEFAPPPSRWAEGPALDISVSLDSVMLRERALELAGGRVASRDGVITRTRPGEPPRRVGPGALLAATMGGRFIVALVPVKPVKDYDARVRLAVYEVP